MRYVMIPKKGEISPRRGVKVIPEGAEVQSAPAVQVRWPGAAAEVSEAIARSR